jgi:choline-sulfatase
VREVALNVMMIMTDQQRVDAMSCVDDGYRTPNLDALAQSGVRFTGAISTSAQCTPSRATWMTGKHPHQLGVNQIGHILDPQEWGIAKEFTKNGYETAYFGKWHLGLSPADHDFQITDYRTDGIELGHVNPDPRYHSHKDAVNTTKAINYLEDHKGETPFFLTVSWYMPHPNVPKGQPFEGIAAYEASYPSSEMPVPTSFYQDDLSSKPPHQSERSQMEQSLVDEEMIRGDASRYRSMISLMDWNLGRLMEKLKTKGLLERTVILFTSDHGDLQGAHRLRLKGVVPYRELYNVPMIVYVPGLKPKRKVIDDLVSSAAVPGTLLEGAGLTVPLCFEGGSFLKHMDEDYVPDNQEMVFFEHYKAYWGYHPFRGVQTRNWKYVYYYEEGQEEMYDLQNDPAEIRNIAGQPEAESARKSLRHSVDEWWAATGGMSRKPIENKESKWGKRV